MPRGKRPQIWTPETLDLRRLRGRRGKRPSHPSAIQRVASAISPPELRCPHEGEGSHEVETTETRRGYILNFTCLSCGAWGRWHSVTGEFVDHDRPTRPLPLFGEKVVQAWVKSFPGSGRLFGS